MRKWLVLSLFLCCFSLCAVELKFDIDSSWQPVQLDDEQQEQLGCSCYEFFQVFERVSSEGSEELCFMIETRYTIDCERLSLVKGKLPGDSIQQLVEYLKDGDCDCDCQDVISIFSFDESTLLIEACIEDEEKGNSLGVVKLFLSASHMGTIAYSYTGDDLSKCDINYWLTALDKTAQFLDDNELPKVHYAVELDPSLWTEIEDGTKIGRTWQGEGDSEFRCVIAPKNTLSCFGNLDNYLSHLESCYPSDGDSSGDASYRLVERDESSALVELTGFLTKFEKVTWAEDYVAATSYKSFEILTDQERQEWINFLNGVKLVEDDV